ncbi:hypothetical protein HSR122_1073 [Halapricum desulfuricans]|uniref:Uncharacterized protein n=1 Tax=Halapricum desulfuricans TaxID=2841257 RepID=A0A897N7F0_9EURY|nr:hypothetical protein HSR122_1073 [Halapricum desulfuricans]
MVYVNSNGVDERHAQSIAVHEAVSDDLEDHYEQQWSRLKLVVVSAVVVMIAGIALVASNQSGPGLALAGVGIVGGVGGGAYVRSRSPEPTVTSIEKGYWTGHLVPDDDGTVVFDATESIESKQFQLRLLDSPEHAQQVKQTLDSMSEYPVVMTDETDVEKEFVQTISTIRSEINDSQTHEISAPVLDEGDPAIDSLSRLVPSAENDTVDAGGVSLSQEEATEQVRTFDEFESMADEDHGESVLLDVSEQSRRIANDLSGLQELATDLLNDHIRRASDMFGLVSYHFYCPDCMTDDIESQLEVRDDGEWYCDTCRSSFDPAAGIPRHRIRDEIVLDVWEQLWIEKDDQRREIYESIEDQKAELQEREYEQQREEIRTVEERIKDIRSKIRDLQTEARAKQGMVDVLGDLMDEYDRLQEQKINQFRQDVSQAFETIDEETERVLEETEGVVNDRIEQAESEAEQRAEMLREDERQRQREFLAAQQAAEDERARKKQAEEDKNAARLAHTINQNSANHPDRRGA